METTPRTTPFPWSRLLAAVLLHGSVLVIVVTALLVPAIVNGGTEPGESTLDPHRSLVSITFVTGFGGLAAVSQAVWLVSRRSSVAFLTVAIITTVLSAPLQGWLIGLPFGIGYASDTSPLPAGTPGSATLLVLEVLAGHLLLVLLLARLISPKDPASSAS